MHISVSFMLYSVWFIWSYSLWCLYSVPDLSEYRVWLGVSDIREGAFDLSKRQEVSIAHVICGPNNSSLALLRLSKWVCGKKSFLEDGLMYFFLFLWCWYICAFMCLLNMYRPALPAENVHTIQLPVAGCSIPEGTVCKMYGWGETKGTHILPFL